ncbi:hypothetical protein VTG60DRAFT_3511 [Thermothelomyces hinnuleus]
MQMQEELDRRQKERDFLDMKSYKSWLLEVVRTALRTFVALLCAYRLPGCSAPFKVPHQPPVTRSVIGLLILLFCASGEAGCEPSEFLPLLQLLLHLNYNRLRTLPSASATCGQTELPVARKRTTIWYNNIATRSLQLHVFHRQTPQDTLGNNSCNLIFF